MGINCCFYNIRVSKLRKKALLLSVFTVAYNILEGIISIMVGFLSRVESLSGGVMMGIIVALVSLMIIVVVDYLLL